MERWKDRVYESYGERAPGRVPASAYGAREAAAERRQYLRRYGRYLPSNATLPILDIGCGSGIFLQALHSRGYSCLEGVDVSPTQVTAAHAGGMTGVILADALEYLRGRPDRFALVTAFSVLEHQTRAELFDLLDAIRASLRPGGLLIAVVPNAKGLFGAHVRFADITHELSFTPVSVHQICAVTGLDPIVVAEHGPVVHGVISAVRWGVWQAIRGGLLIARVAEGADWRWPVFTQDLIFVARRPSAP